MRGGALHCEGLESWDGVCNVYGYLRLAIPWLYFTSGVI